MEENNDNRLHSVVLTDFNDLKESKASNNTTDKSFVCCFSNKWWFDHLRPAAYTNYDENDKVYFMWFDCCAWCLEFEQKKWCCCKESVYCNLCCCRIHFY